MGFALTNKTKNTASWLMHIFCAYNACGSAFQCNLEYSLSCWFSEFRTVWILYHKYLEQYIIFLVVFSHNSIFLFFLMLYLQFSLYSTLKWNHGNKWLEAECFGRLGRHLFKRTVCFVHLLLQNNRIVTSPVYNKAPLLIIPAADLGFFSRYVDTENWL